MIIAIGHHPSPIKLSTPFYLASAGKTPAGLSPKCISPNHPRRKGRSRRKWRKEEEEEELEERREGAKGRIEKEEYE